MIVELDKLDIITLIRGICPPMEFISKFSDMGLGYYIGGFKDEWHWNDRFSKEWNKYSEKELYDLYINFLKR